VDISTASISVHGVALTFTIAMMRFLLRLLPLCFLILLPPTSVMAQTANLAHPPKPGTDGVYEVSASNLKKLDSSPAAEFPSELSAYEVTDTVAIEVTVSPEGRVRKAKAVSGKIEALPNSVTGRRRSLEPRGICQFFRSSSTIRRSASLRHTSCSV
jgi:hypothetical protein